MSIGLQHGTVSSVRRQDDTSWFAALARECSVCPSAMVDGKIGWISRGTADSAIEEAVLDKPIGHIAQVEGSSGFHLIEVLGESEPPGLQYNEAGAAAQAEAEAAPARNPIAAVSVRDLSEVLSSESQVCATLSLVE